MKKKIVIISIVAILVLSVLGIFLLKRKNQEAFSHEEKSVIENNFKINLIKEINKQEKETNYLISPYSIELALNMLKDGADGNTLKELENVIGSRKINDVTVKNKISVANGTFIKNNYKNLVLDEYYNIIKNKYASEILYDEFKTPDVINNWVKKKTNGMIEKILEDIDEKFVMGLANAIAIDVDWNSSFDCNDTFAGTFTKLDGTTMKTEMMFQTFTSENYKYIKNDEVSGIILPYKKYNKLTGEIDEKKGKNLEFIGILPEANVYEYINNLTEEKLNKILSSSSPSSEKNKVELKLPRFKYDYQINDLSIILENLGIKEAFNPISADFTKIIPRDKQIDNIYVGASIHKTHIDLNEKGTKAAAVTYFGMYTSGISAVKEDIKITFDKPFIYMIRDSETKEILFFGVVYEPNQWQGKTCSEINVE